ncbi:MAG: hypothetical protein ACOX3T_00450 [Bdellovibrionota bacterium]
MKKFFKKYYIYLLIALFSFFSYKFYFVCDDAYISFQYAKNLANGNGLVFNKGFEPVEGYTNFLWVLIASFFYYAKIPLTIAMPIISYLFAVFFICFINNVIVNKLKFSYKVSFLTLLFSLVLFPSFFVWSTSGLETLVYSSLIFLLFYYLIIEERKLNKIKNKKNNEAIVLLISLLLSLIRFEGVFFAIFIYLISFFRKKTNVNLFLKFIFLYSIYYISRTLYFGDLFPNTVYMKVNFSFELLKRGLNYNIIYLLTEPLSILSFFGLMIMVIKKVKYSFEYLAIYLALFLYPIIVGGDFLPFSRFLVPLCLFQVLPLAFIINEILNIKKSKALAIISLSIVLALALVSFLSIYNVHAFSRNFLSKFHFRFNTREFRSERESYDYLIFNNYRRMLMAKALLENASDSSNTKNNNKKPSVVLGGVGLVAFYSDMIIYDIYGLTNKELRGVKAVRLRSPGHDKVVEPSYFLKYKPTFTDVVLNVKNKREAWYKSWYKNNIENNKKYSNYGMLSVPTKDKNVSILVLKKKN